MSEGTEDRPFKPQGIAGHERDNKGVTRRDIIKWAGATLAGLFAGQKISDTLSNRTGDNLPQTELENSNSIQEQIIDGKVTVVFSYLPKQEKKVALQHIDKESKRQSKYFENPKNLDIQNTLKNQSIVSEVINKEPINSPLGKEWLKKIMLGLIFTESKGDVNARGGKGLGLCQLEPPAVEMAVKRTQLKQPINLFDAKTNITLAVHYLDRLFSLYSDPSLALWAYNMGEGNMNTMIKLFAKSKAISEDERKSIDNELSKTPGPNEPYGTNKLVTKYNANVINLLENNDVQTFLQRKTKEGTFAIHPESLEYVPRIAVATQLLHAV